MDAYKVILVVKGREELMKDCPHSEAVGNRIEFALKGYSCELLGAGEALSRVDAGLTLINKDFTGR